MIEIKIPTNIPHKVTHVHITYTKMKKGKKSKIKTFRMQWHSEIDCRLKIVSGYWQEKSLEIDFDTICNKYTQKQISYSLETYPTFIYFVVSAFSYSTIRIHIASHLIVFSTVQLYNLSTLQDFITTKWNYQHRKMTRKRAAKST